MTLRFFSKQASIVRSPCDPVAPVPTAPLTVVINTRITPLITPTVITITITGLATAGGCGGLPGGDLRVVYPVGDGTDLAFHRHLGLAVVPLVHPVVRVARGGGGSSVTEGATTVHSLHSSGPRAPPRVDGPVSIPNAKAIGLAAPIARVQDSAEETLAAGGRGGGVLPCPTVTARVAVAARGPQTRWIGMRLTVMVDK